MSRAVVIGTSAGGVEALQRVAGLPADLDAPVLVVLHLPPFSASNLPSILSRAGPLEAKHAVDHEPLRPGRIYIAPPDRHLLVTPTEVRVVRGPHENNHRPAIDPLFRSAALAFGAGAIAIVLTGALDDGAAGVAAVSARGGTVLVQDPPDALYPSMPINAIAADSPEYVLPLREIPKVLSRVVLEPVVNPNGGEAMEDELRLEQSFAEFEPRAIKDEGAPGDPAPFSCPTCGGTLWEAPDESVLRFRCRVGHAFGAESLLQAQGVRLEEALWTALRALEERGHLAKRVAPRLRDAGNTKRAMRFETVAAEAEQQAAVLRDTLLGIEQPQV